MPWDVPQDHTPFESPCTVARGQGSTVGAEGHTLEIQDEIQDSQFSPRWPIRRSGIQDSHFSPRRPIRPSHERPSRGIQGIQDSHFPPRRPIRPSHEQNTRKPLFTPPAYSSVARTPKPGAQDHTCKLTSDLQIAQSPLHNTSYHPLSAPSRRTAKTRLAQSCLPPTGLSPPSGLSLKRDSRRSLTLEPDTPTTFSTTI
jgi:hypothetical protein